MTRGSSINFKKSSAGFEHNDRTEEREPKHLLPEEFRQRNECDRSAIEARELLKEMVENAKEKYQERTGQKCQAKILSVEAVINLEAHHTLKDVEKINEYLEQKHGLRAVQSSIHRDEGHINDDGKPEYNLHAHVVYCNLDQEGKTILKGLEKADFRDLQSFVAEALEMTRGQSADITNAKHKTPQEFRYEKTLATNKDLKTEIAQLREQLKDRGATRSEYAELEQLNKELKEQIKAKDLTIDQLKDQVSTIERDPMNGIIVAQLKDEKWFLENENKSLKRELSELKENGTSVDIFKDIDEAYTKIREMAKIANSSDEAINELEKSIPTHDPKKVAIAVYNSHIVADTGFMGKLGGEKKDTDLLIANMAKEIEKRDKLLKKAVDMLKKTEITKMSISNAMKNVIEGSKKHLEAIFSKITGKSMQEAQKERTELLNKLRTLEDIARELNKQNEQQKSKGLER